MTTSLYLDRPVRSEAQARADRDDCLIAGLLVAMDALRLTAAKQQDRAASERGRLACAALIGGLEALRHDVMVPF